MGPALVHLAGLPTGQLAFVNDIAVTNNIPKKFLDAILGELRNAGFVQSRKGKDGGYRLARDASTISLLDVIEAVEGDSRRQSCVLRGGPCGRDGICDVHEVFFAGQERLLAHFAGSMLSDLASPATGEALLAAREG